MLRDLAEAISITTFRVWRNNIGKGRIKDCFNGGMKEGGIIWKGGDKYPMTVDLSTSSGNTLLAAGDEEEVAGPSADIPSKRNKGSKVNAFL